MGAASLLGVLVACDGNERDEEPNPGAVMSDDDASSPQDASTDAATLPADARDAGERIRFTVRMPGASESLEASLASAGDDAIRIDAYPASVHSTIGYSTLPMAFDGAFAESFCTEIDQLAVLASQGGTLSPNARQRVRADGSLTAHVFLYPFVGPAFDAALRDAARAKGATAGGFTIENPLVLESATLELVLAPNASSRHIGDVDALQASISASLSARDLTARQSGIVMLPLSAKDLWCDLARERASLVIRTNGKAGQIAFEGESATRGVEALAERD